MSKAPWTPGPWRACKDGTCVCGHIWAEGDKHVATVHENTRDGDGTVHAEWSREERVANAQLIAAAPRLAEALEAWLAWAAKNQANLYFGDLPESSFTQIGDLVATSRAALAGVKGGELGEGWDEPYAHRDPGNARPARTARKAKGER